MSSPRSTSLAIHRDGTAIATDEYRIPYGADDRHHRVEHTSRCGPITYSAMIITSVPVRRTVTVDQNATAAPHLQRVIVEIQRNMMFYRSRLIPPVTQACSPRRHPLSN